MKIKASQLRQVIRETVTEDMVDELDQAVRIKPTADTSRNGAARDFKAAKKGSSASKFYGGQLTGNKNKATNVRNGDYGGHGEFGGKDKTWSRQDETEEMDEDIDAKPKTYPSPWDDEQKKGPPPLPGKKPAGGGPPNLKGFKADCAMMSDAAGRVKSILDAGQGNTGEALRWLDKVIQFATSAKGALKVK